MKKMLVSVSVTLVALLVTLIPAWAEEGAEPKRPSVPEVTDMKGLDDLLKSTDGSLAFIFKHSTTCSISGGAARRLDALLDENKEKLPPFHKVLVIESRPVSNAIAEQLKVTHESPQLILVKDGKAVWSITHEKITAIAVYKALAEHGEKKTDS